MNGKFGDTMKLSIITINYNNALGLQKTIESVLSQTYTDFEYIIIDGASTDGSVEILKEFENQVKDIIKPYFIWLSEPDSGIYNAMNKGIQKATGEYLLFLNSGDWLYNKDVLKEVFAQNITDDIFYGQEVKELNGKLIKSTLLDVYYLTFSSLKNSHISHQCSFIKRTLFTEKIGLYAENYKIISDWAFMMLAIFKYNCSIRTIDTIISVYDTNGISSVEAFKKLQLEERRQFLDKHFRLFMVDYDNMDAFMNKGYIKNILKLRDAFNSLLKR